MWAASSACPRTWLSANRSPDPAWASAAWSAITRDRLEALREADAIVREEIDKAGLTIWQYFAVVPDFRATGVREGKRAYDWPLHHPLHQHRRCHDCRGSRARLGAAQAHHRPRHGRGPRHLPRVLRPHAEARRHGRVGVS